VVGCFVTKYVEHRINSYVRFK